MFIKLHIRNRMLHLTVSVLLILFRTYFLSCYSY